MTFIDLTQSQRLNQSDPFAIDKVLLRDSILLLFTDRDLRALDLGTGLVRWKSALDSRLVTWALPGVLPQDSPTARTALPR